MRSQIIKILLEREWIKVVGHRDVPGKPALLGTTRFFLDYFNLQSLNQLPTLEELQDVMLTNVQANTVDTAFEAVTTKQPVAVVE